MGTQTPDIIAFGEPLVAMYPERGEGAAADRYTMTWGGDASNFVLAATKLGVSSAILTRVGTDAFGDRFVELWNGAGVATDLVQRDPERSTGLYFAVFTGTSHAMVYYRKGSAATAVSRDAIDWNAIASARVVHVSGITQAIAPAMLDLSFEIMAYAKRHDVLVSYDVNYRPPLWPAARAAAIARYTAREFADVFTLTDEESQTLGLGDTPADLAAGLGTLPRHTVVKRGAAGATVVTASSTVDIPGYRVTVQDTVGAGDAFDAGLVTQLLRGADLQQAVEYAVATGALVCTGEGPLVRQPNHEEVTALMCDPQSERRHQ